MNTHINTYQLTGDLKARNDAIMSTYTWVAAVARTLRGASVIVSDLIQEGMIAVIHACDTFDSTKGASFKTYAGACARFQMLDYIRRDRVIPNGSETMHSHNLSGYVAPKCHSEIIALSEKTGISYKGVQKYAMLNTCQGGSVELAVSNTDIEKEVIDLEEAEQFQEKLSTLKYRHREILNHHVEGDTYQAIGRLFDISHQRVEQILKETKRMLS